MTNSINMKKNVFLFAFLLSLSTVFGQTKTHKIVFQLATGDTLVHKGLMRQLNNVLEYWPTAKIEVVIHNDAIGFMRNTESVVAKEVKEMQERGITFAVCKNTMKRKKLTEADILPSAVFVPVGIAEIVEKQEDGYAYIKAGY
jgi:uncharacterized protein